MFLLLVSFLILKLNFFSSNQKVTLAQQQLQAEYDKLKTEETEKSQKLQELMSVDDEFIIKRSILCSKNEAHPNSRFHDPLSPKKHPSKWEEFVPFKNELNKYKKFAAIHKSKFEKESENNLTKMSETYHTPMSIFHVHTFHLHLFISLTLLLVTHRCPQQFLIVV